MDAYAVITTNGNKVDNVVVWDGKSEWGPGKGYTTVKLQKNQWCNIGAVYDKSSNTFSFPDDYTQPDPVL